MKSAKPRHQTFQVLSDRVDGRRIWRFHAGKQDTVPAGEITLAPDAKPPKSKPTDDWKALVSPQLNIAWLPADKVFVRALQVPACEPGELPAMMEFQIDKVSPLPANQVVWTVIGVPHAEGQQQTALVMLASRAEVEEFLDREVAAGFLADQLDLPLVRWWSGLKPSDNGLWLLFDATPERWLCLVAWYIGGVWQDVTLVHLPPGNAAAEALTAQLGQTAWGGEMEGWLATLPEVKLAAEDAVSTVLSGPLAEWSGRPVQPVKMADPAALATASARAFRAPPAATLIPSEWVASQRQKFIDRLWMSGLGAVGITYLIFLFGFLIWLNVRKYQVDDLRSEVAAMGLNFTNTLQLKAQVSILEEQVALRYAALEAWQAVVNSLPSELTLTQLDFQRGRTVQLAGTVSPDSTSEVTKFNSELKKAQLNGQPLFAAVKPAQISSRPGAPSATWNFEAELRRNESP